MQQHTRLVHTTVTPYTGGVLTLLHVKTHPIQGDYRGVLTCNRVCKRVLIESRGHGVKEMGAASRQRQTESLHADTVKEQR